MTPQLPNKAQWFALVQTLVPFIGGLLVMRGVMTATEFDSIVNQIGKIITDVVVLAGMLGPLVTAVWSMIDKSNKNVAISAAQIPGVTVVVNGKAPAEVKQAALDPALPNVVADTPNVKMTQE